MGMQRKERVSFTLSPESMRYLEKVKRQRKGLSMSAVLDDIISDKRREAERAAMELKMTAYYDSLTEDEVAEGRTWGELTERDFPLE